MNSMCLLWNVFNFERVDKVEKCPSLTSNNKLAVSCLVIKGHIIVYRPFSFYTARHLNDRCYKTRFARIHYYYQLTLVLWLNKASFDQKDNGVVSFNVQYYYVLISFHFVDIRIIGMKPLHFFSVCLSAFCNLEMVCSNCFERRVTANKMYYRSHHTETDCNLKAFPHSQLTYYDKAI